MNVKELCKYCERPQKDWGRIGYCDRVKAFFDYCDYCGEEEKIDEAAKYKISVHRQAGNDFRVIYKFEMEEAG